MKFKDILLLADHAQLRIHGNGFLQAETKDGNKIHVWDPRIPKQKVPTPIHNHNHGFKSKILHGGIFMSEYTVWKAYAHAQRFLRHQAIPRKGKDTRLEPVGDEIQLRNRRDFLLPTGSEYMFPLNMDLYHEVVPVWSEKEMVVTAVERLPHKYNELELPTVLVQTDQMPDNDFDRYAFVNIATAVYENAVTLISEIEYEI